VKNLEIIYLPLGELVPDARNARTHTEEQVAQIADSMKEYGWTNPVLLRPNKSIIAGHGRVLAAQKLAIEAVPCIILDGLTDLQARAYMLADNRIALNAGWNTELLALELLDLQAAGYQLDLTGFSKLELKALIGPEAAVRQGKTADDAVPPPGTKAVSQHGDIWALGRHRLMVGDATNLADVQRLMGDFKADIVWTDPPYNVAYEGQAGAIMNDDQEAAAFDRFLLRAFQSCYWAMKPGACIYVTHADTERWAFTQAFETAQLKLSQVLIWVKNGAVFGRQDYNWQHEPILYGWKEGAGHFFAGNFTLTTVIEEPLDVSKLTAGQAKSLCVQLLEARRSTVIHEDKPTKSELHPTMKPVALVQRMLEASSHEEAVVFDPFGGSGTTLITAEKTNRRAFLLELDPRYADVIIKRWQDFTGREATHSSGKTFSAVQKLPAHKVA
jgi:DNA modification methylase